MICACETQEFTPYGRQVAAEHPRKAPMQGHGVTEHGLPIVKALDNISLKESKVIMLHKTSHTTKYCTY